jgi:HEPN domain-containing protein
MSELTDKDNIECHLQSIGMGTLICKAATQTGDHTTNEVSPETCFGCDAGKIYRELGCDAILPHIRIHSFYQGQQISIDQLLCKIKKRFTSYDQCKGCNLRAAETTKDILAQVKGIFTENEFYSSYKEIEKARTSIRDGKFDTAITNSISSVESTMRIIHEKSSIELPNNKVITELYKSTRQILKLDEIDKEKVVAQLINTMAGLISSFGNLRNALSDAHGRGNISNEVQEYIAELALNTSATLSTFFVRRFNEINKKGV